MLKSSINQKLMHKKSKMISPEYIHFKVHLKDNILQPIPRMKI